MSNIDFNADGNLQIGYWQNNGSLCFVEPTCDESLVFVTVVSHGTATSLGRAVKANRARQAAEMCGFSFDGAKLHEARMLPSDTHWCCQKSSGANARRRWTVYFIQSELGGLIKIGKAENVSERLIAIQSCCPCRLVILGVIQDHDGKLEKNLHRKFKADRVHGEWFNPSRRLLEYIRSTAEVHAVRG